MGEGGVGGNCGKSAKSLNGWAPGIGLDRRTGQAFDFPSFLSLSRRRGLF